jgi:transposase InsO family protein
LSHIANALHVSRPHLSHVVNHERKERAGYTKADDAALLARIRKIVDDRQSYGYRRVHAMLNREAGAERVNHKRVYRVMKEAKLLFVRNHKRPERIHEGKVITLKSDMRWCSDMFEVRCWNGEKVHVAFALDCCDREVISWVAAPRHLDSTHVCDLMAKAVERRFSVINVPHPIQWLTDNGPPYVSSTTRKFGKKCGLLMCNSPAYSPESNGMAEAFVKTIKRDYIYLNDVSTAQAVLAQLPKFFEDYNEIAPHKGLNMLSPRMFRAALSSSAEPAVRAGALDDSPTSPGSTLPARKVACHQ